MARGGARNRSGPPPNPDSERSERRKISLQALPAQGYDGPVPEFPLDRHEFITISDKGYVVDEEATRSFREAELKVWHKLWRSPQAAAWALPENQWRHRIVATYARHSVRIEAPNASPALLGQIHRFADQIGMTDAGLAAMGWKIAASEAETPTTGTSGRQKAAAPAPKRGSRSRLKVLDGGAA